MANYSIAVEFAIRQLQTPPKENYKGEQILNYFDGIRTLKYPLKFKHASSLLSLFTPSLKLKGDEYNVMNQRWIPLTLQTMSQLTRKDVLD